MIRLWQGSANTWDCDENDHMNVRVYVEKAMEGLGLLAHAMGLPSMFHANAVSTLIPARQHIRFIREVMAARPLSLWGGVTAIGETSVDTYQEMRHGDGSVAAAFRMRLIHARSDDGRPFAWSADTRARLETLRVTPPEQTAPRSLDLDTDGIVPEEVTRARAETVGAPAIGAGMVLAHHLDIHGRMWAPWFIGRVSDAVPNLLHAQRQEAGEAAGAARVGGAVLEYRLNFHDWPGAGDLFEVRSGLGRVQEKVHSLVHWMLDPDTGRAWMTSEAVAVTFDLDTRKVLPVSPAWIEALEARAPRGLEA